MRQADRRSGVDRARGATPYRLSLALLGLRLLLRGGGRFRGTVGFATARGLDPDAIKWNRIRISSLSLSMIFRKTGSHFALTRPFGSGSCSKGNSTPGEALTWSHQPQGG